MNIWTGEIREDRGTQSNSVFSRELWVERQLESLRQYLKQLDSSSLPVYPPRYSTLPLIFPTIDVRRLLDYGGGNGWTFYHLQNVANTENLESYWVLENKELVSKIKHSFAPKIKLTYSHMLPQEYVDLVYANSVLQYVEDKDFFAVVNSTSPQFVLIDNFLANSKNFYTEQNFYSEKINVKFRDLNLFSDAMRLHGYEKIWVSPYYSFVLGSFQGLKTENFPPEYRIDRSFSLLFERLD
ncbi:hypothetical protein [Polynucleobacter sp. MWH-Braz-FAM2G]|uniref:hypothetical protein n=1 Tax=Polynucleobacter sp. MWH-Braz-FAM2G TaxID=1855883 RepID=UPI001BFDDACD|nr:hypothetical protein [Polynucleobacter sp. MWH-Braz-FAM2G]QWD91089.1 hypothetical protein FD973_01750 [Polynucleobacter sp. MWH-Braz-FAM2G]